MVSLLFTGEEFGYSLSIQRAGVRRYSVVFGCQAGPTAGDGGEWMVAFGDEGDVVELSSGHLWIS